MKKILCWRIWRIKLAVLTYLQDLLKVRNTINGKVNIFKK